MTTDTKDAAGQALCETLGNLAFMFADPQDPDAPPSEPRNGLKVSLEFKGAAEGALELAIPENLAPEIAANILGCDEDDDEAITAARDSLREVLNITCGKLLPQLYGEDKLFDLSAPLIGEMNQTEWCEMQQDAGTVRYQVDEKPILVRLTISA
jgi:CheY-specific phosphatase CheX